MSRSIAVRRSLALTSALTLAMWGPTALSASADPGHSSSHATGHHASGHHASKRQAPTSHAPKSHAPKSNAPKSNAAKSHPTTSHEAKPPASAGHPSSKGGASHGHAPSDHAPTSPAPQGGSSAPRGGSKGSPAGNNGTVKIAPIGENDGTPQNHPHQVCGFQVEWYGYEQGSDIVSTVSFAMQSPTKDVGLTVNGPSSVFVGGDPATGAGTTTGLDGTEVYTLGFDGVPHPKQGYHVKVTVSTPRSQGNDTKTKVFWVQPCTDTTPGGETPGGGTPGGETPGGGTPGGETPGGGTPGSETQGGETPGDEDTAGHETNGHDTTDNETGSDADVLGEQATAGEQAQGGTSVRSADQGQVPTAVEAGEGNAVLNLVSSPLPLLLIALGALLTGAAFVTRRRARADA